MSSPPVVLQFAAAGYAYAGVSAIERVTLTMHSGDFMAVASGCFTARSCRRIARTRVWFRDKAETRVPEGSL